MSKRKKLWKKKEERVAHEKREGRESSCPKNLEREKIGNEIFFGHFHINIS
jgi:hypothetical protein